MTAGPSRPLVLDAPAALALILGGNGADRVWVLAPEPVSVVVPSSFWYEVSDMLGRRMRWAAGRVTEALFSRDRLGLGTRPPDRAVLSLGVDGLELHGQTAYDAAYLVLTEQEDGDL